MNSNRPANDPGPARTISHDAPPDEAAEIRYLAENTDLSPRQARELVGKYGTDREELLRRARSMKAES